MDRKKMIYIGSLLILTAIISIASFSYAIWSNKSEQRGKLNIVAGSLNYELVSSDLTNNSITIPANTSKTIEIEINSLNNIESKYELYYVTDSSIIIGYSLDTIDNPTGIIGQRSSKKVTVTIKNRTSSPATITFGCQGGFSSEELVLAQGTSIPQISNCEYQPGAVVKAAGYTGSADPFEVPCDGYYKVELWGAQGNGASTLVSPGGLGGYTSGMTDLHSGDTLYLYVGESRTDNNASFNAGSLGGTANEGTNTQNLANGFGGGGATDIRSVSGAWDNSESLKSRVMVAGGGGGATSYGISITTGKKGAAGGYGGGLIGGTADAGRSISYSGYDRTAFAQGANQTGGGTIAQPNPNTCGTGAVGTFGIGGRGGYRVTSGTVSYQYGAGGGGGFYGGTGGGCTNGFVDSGSGGSSYISGHTGCVGITSQSESTPKSGCTTGTTDISCSLSPYGYNFINTIIIDGGGYSWTNTKGDLELMPNPNGGFYESGTGHTGNGYAKITYLGSAPLPIGQTWIYTYTGNEQTFTASVAGNYRIELWGASGGNPIGSSGNGSSYPGGLGGYTSGVINLNTDDSLYLHIGNTSIAPSIASTYNGGGRSDKDSDTYGGGAGGGATDIRTVSGTWNDADSLRSRIMVAGAGGGSAYYANAGGGAGGGLISYSGGMDSRCGSQCPTIAATGGTQISGGTRSGAGYSGNPGWECYGQNGTFGIGGDSSVSPSADCRNNNGYRGGAGGGGWYGGGGGARGYSYSGAGGSSYISGHTGCVGVTSTTSSNSKSGCTTGTTDNSCSLSPYGYTFTETNMIDGAGHTWTNEDQGIDNNNLMPKPGSGYYASGVGHSGNGYVRITYLGE